jgi:phosphopantothenoylcysteine decarboxylase/phosphopantothenate--cysteine ligase
MTDEKALNEKVLAGRRIVLCVSASISVYKSISILRNLIKLGAFVSVATTPSTSRFVGSATFSALASEPVYDDLWSNRSSIAHTNLGNNADLVLLAPATASTISKIANGYCDDIVSAVILATPKNTPVVIAPAMHDAMYENFATQKNVESLKDNGYYFVGPQIGELAGGDVGIGRLSDEEVIVKKVVDLLEHMPKKQNVQTSSSSTIKKIVRKKMLVTAGGTREPIDPVRVITNRSSGKMGHCIADAANICGYDVTLVTTSYLDSSDDINRIDVETADEMHDVIMKDLAKFDVVVMAAAVGDVKSKNYSKEKLKREDGIKSIVLVDNIDISSEIMKNMNRDTQLVCFAAETENVLENATKKALKKKPALLVVNDVSRTDSGFNSSTNKVWMGSAPNYDFVEYETLSKEEVAYNIIEQLENRNSVV